MPSQKLFTSELFSIKLISVFSPVSLFLIPINLISGFVTAWSEENEGQQDEISIPATSMALQTQSGTSPFGNYKTITSIVKIYDIYSMSGSNIFSTQSFKCGTYHSLEKTTDEPAKKKRSDLRTQAHGAVATMKLENKSARVVGRQTRTSHTYSGNCPSIIDECRSLLSCNFQGCLFSSVWRAKWREH